MTIDELINIVLDALKGCVQGDSVGREERECDAEIDKGKLLGSCGGSGFAVPRIERRGSRAVCECSDPVDCLFYFPQVGKGRAENKEGENQAIMQIDR